MKNILLLLAATLFINTALADPVPPRLMKKLQAYQVMKANLKNGVLKLTMSHPMVTHEIYEETITKGACAVLADSPEKGWEKTIIDRIEVLSKDERQGYAFIDARQSCLAMQSMTDKEKKKAFFTEHTWICSMEICDEPPAEK